MLECERRNIKKLSKKRQKKERMEEEKRKSDVESANASEDFEEQASFFDNLGTQLQQQQQKQQQQQQQRQQSSAAQLLEGNFVYSNCLRIINSFVLQVWHILQKSNLNFSQFDITFLFATFHALKHQNV